MNNKVQLDLFFKKNSFNNVISIFKMFYRLNFYHKITKFNFQFLKVIFKIFLSAEKSVIFNLIKSLGKISKFYFKLYEIFYKELNKIFYNKMY